MSARLSAFVIWALVSATAVFWALRLAVRAPEAPPHVVATADVLTASGDLTRLLGAPPRSTPALAAAPEAASRFRLLGIMAPPRSGTHEGVALIAIDGKPARAFPVGSTIDGDLVLQSVSLRTASLGPAQGQRTVVLEVPRLPTAATGTLPPPGAPALPAPPPAIPGVPGLPPAGAGAPTAAPTPTAPAMAPQGVPQPSGFPPGTVMREGTQSQ